MTHFSGQMKLLKQGFLYFLLSTLFLGILLMCYIPGDAIVPVMDVGGWLFFVTSCLSHAAIVVLALALVFYLPWALLQLKRLAASLFVGAVSIMAMLAFVNMQVYKIYRFHINGFILNMITGPHAGDIFDFSPQLYLTEGLLLAGILVVCIALWWITGRLVWRWSRRLTVSAVVLLTVCLLTANGIHAYGVFTGKTSVMQSARLVPYYFPLSANSLLKSMGLEQTAPQMAGGMSGEGDICYPLQPLQRDTVTAKRPNIVLILIDAWSKRALTPDVMPNLWQIAHEEQWYQNHVSCSNGTRYAVFGLFTGLPPYYYTAFEANHLSPLLVEELLRQDYDFRTYPSASLENPPFHRLLFQNVPNLRTSTEGESSYERDLQIKKDLIADLPQLKQDGKPFFTFIFFDLLHAYSLPRELLNRFQPSWDYGKFDELNNDMDPTPFWNLYRNSAYQTDQMVGEVVNALKQQGLWNKTLVFITGDHAQEYNENHKNYWGHNSNFSTYQIGVPLIVHQPSSAPAVSQNPSSLEECSAVLPQSPSVFTHRTTHYDLVPTLMHDWLGITNPTADYTVGHLLSDHNPRFWHFVGNELRYAFIVEGDTILTKEGNGWIEVTDAKLNLVNNYRIKPHDFDEAIQQLNRFFKTR